MGLECNTIWDKENSVITVGVGGSTEICTEHEKEQGSCTLHILMPPEQSGEIQRQVLKSV